jgi:hypothetical protein
MESTQSSRRGRKPEHLELGHLGHHQSPTEPNRGQLAAGHQLVGEGPGDAEETGRLGDGEGQAVTGQKGRPIVTGLCRGALS